MSNLRPDLLRIEAVHVKTTNILQRGFLSIVICNCTGYNVWLKIRDSTNNRGYSHSTDANRYSISISIGVCNSSSTLVLDLLLMRIIIWVYLLVASLVAIPVLRLWRLQKLACISLFICYLYLLWIHFFYNNNFYVNKLILIIF